MRVYVRPYLEQVVLRSEERFAGSACNATGCCTAEEIVVIEASGQYHVFDM